MLLRPFSTCLQLLKLGDQGLNRNFRDVGSGLLRVLGLLLENERLRLQRTVMFGKTFEVLELATGCTTLNPASPLKLNTLNKQLCRSSPSIQERSNWQLPDL